ncbi:hypothetical protein OSB04_003779 [Centaurea solstitialis]|uniref:PPC domain-containing protein n=1 Tax=Centaurea solstitialis TaxID=347529 RepID=A0AA38U311_9ASTR|nr:hypothetical protein OSB04_003779 [Centaurea solstitialis]
MSPYVLDVPGGLDIIAAVTRFCNHRDTALCVLSGNGAISDVSFRQPTTTNTITFQGRFDLLSISATVLPSSMSSPRPPQTPLADRFAVSLAAPQGQTIGGAVTGPLIAAGTVYIVAASFNNPLYHRLPIEEEVEEEEDDRVRSTSGSGGGDGGSRRHAAAADMYGCQPGGSDSDLKSFWLVSEEIKKRKKCETPVRWLEAREKQFAWPEIGQNTTDKVRRSQDRQKSYADKKRRLVELQVEDRLMLKVQLSTDLVEVDLPEGLLGLSASRIFGRIFCEERHF